MNRNFLKNMRRAAFVLAAVALVLLGLTLSSCGKATGTGNEPVIVCLVRHAEATSNIDGVYAGKGTESHLTESGKVQAEILGQALSKITCDRAIASEMTRTQETADIILENNVNPVPKVEVDAGFDEIDFGKADGMTSADAQAAFGADLFGTYDDADFTSPTGGESAYELADRVNTAMNALASAPENAGKTLFITGHSSAGWWLESQWPDQCSDSLKNASVTVLKYEAGQWALLIYNETDFTDFEKRYREAVRK